MAISPMEVMRANNNTINFEEVSKVEKFIDTILKDPEQSKNYLFASPSYTMYEIKVPGALSDEDNEYLRSLYIKSGWRVVEVYNDIDLAHSNKYLVNIRLYS